MGTIVCQECNAPIAYFEDEKVTIFYTTKCNCSNHQNSEYKQKISKNEN